MAHTELSLSERRKVQRMTGRMGSPFFRKTRSVTKLSNAPSAAA
jgi:hypothetical protein